MKTLAFIASIFSSVLASAAADFGSATTVFARAYEKANYGTFEVVGDGLNGQSLQYVYYRGQVKSTPELVAPFKFSYPLDFRSYKTTVHETATIYDKEGNTLFVSENQYCPIEKLSDDGKKLSYDLPEAAGHVRSYLAQQKIPFDGDYASVEFLDGYSMDLEIVDGFIIVDGWMYERNGTFTAWKGGVATVTDIQTGLKVPGGLVIRKTNVDDGVEGVQVIVSRGLVFMTTIMPNRYGSELYETSTEATGSLVVNVRDWWGNRPIGLYYTLVGSGKEKQYLLPNASGEFRIPCLQGQTFHVLFITSPDSGKG